ncbi:MAG: LPS export ABC transporter periplasmic protein LptC [Candidatus Omnitrophota bacterium]|nr:LPS export ABC transporter periplasmic protein LptC [Candidatus Omnitrophota bacterium]
MRISLFLILGFFVAFNLSAEEAIGPNTDSSNQQILDFELSGFGEQGKKTWEVKGNSADIFSDTVKLNDIKARVYGEQDNVNLVADSGVYDKANGKVHLKDNVVVTSDSGAKLVTDSLDWQQDIQRVSSKDNVDITKDNLKAVGRGIEAEPNLKKVKLNEDVKVDIKDANFSFAPQENSGQPKKEAQEPITITCDGSLNVDYEKQVAVFNKNVKVVHAQEEMYADKMTVSFDIKGKSIEKVESVGHVKIINGENTTYSEEAVYTAKDKKVVLTGRPRLVIYSSEGINASFGN